MIIVLNEGEKIHSSFFCIRQTDDDHRGLDDGMLIFTCLVLVGKVPRAQVGQGLTITWRIGMVVTQNICKF